MGVILALMPLYHSRQSGGVIRQIQRAAQGDLKLVADAEKGFKNRTGFYTSDFNALAIVPKMILYKIGFASPSVAHHEIDRGDFVHRPELKDIDALRAAFPKLDIKYSPVTKLDSIDFAAAASKYCADCVATDSAFKALAVGNLDDDEELDVWTIDDKGDVRHLVDDLAAK
ncbi:MAG: hypothetical protein V4760_03095 [Bdellovibrionota bacterium]